MFDLFKNKAKSYKDVDASEFSKYMEEENSIVLDVRTPMELESGKIKNALNVDLMSPGFLDELEKLPKDKNYLVYCRSGNRSGQACHIMSKRGFSKLNNLNHGTMGWPFELE